ncbi:MAG TPA: hypothetical protein PLB27_05485 [Bacteroidales bacterium]|nr:hypothetical protein [Bacteroidales bacterium]
MRISRISIIYLFIVFIICLSFTVVGCTKVRSGMLIATEASLSSFTQDGVTDPGRYISGSRIIAIDPGKPSKIRVLTGDFYSAAYPEISYDGKQIIFSAQKKQGDTWQIWEMSLKNLRCRQLTFLRENCTDPAYLPGGKMVFSKLTVNDTVGTAHCLYTGNIDGSDIRQITFSPCDNFATQVLKDGRLLTVSRQLLPQKNNAMLAVMRPDGTKSDMFYMNKGKSIMASDPRESVDGRIIFLETTGNNSPGGFPASVTYNRPLHSRIDLSAGEEEFKSVLPVTSDRYLVSYRKSGSDRFALYEFNAETKTTGRLVFSDPEYDILDVTVAEPYERPKKLPSEVDLQVKTGLLLCQDVNFTGFKSKADTPGLIEARLIEVMGPDSTYGTVRVEEDGSFQLKILADKPFRIRTLDEKGQTLSGPCAWMWMRPNERRGCVGCHEDPETVPVNRVSLAVKKPPVIIPVHITTIKEKTVELE